jgi:hypothetical protein
VEGVGGPTSQQLIHQIFASAMTEYVIKEVSQSLWMVFANRKSVGACADETRP